jgi:hypothetical protein
MKNKISLLSLLVVSLLFSCKKNNNVVDTRYPLTLLTKVTGQTNITADGALKTVNEQFYYDSSNMLVKIKDGKKTIHIAYNHFGPNEIRYVDSTGSVITRRISNSRIVTSNPYPAPSETEEIYYEEDKLISQFIVKYSYTNGLLTEIKTTVGDVVQQIKKYNYTGKNLASFDDGKGNLYSYKYNDKLNPYANVYLRHLTGEIDFISPNLANEIEYGPTGSKTVIKIIYTYNEEGYPLTAKATDANGNKVIDYKFEYRKVTEGYY